MSRLLSQCRVRGGDGRLHVLFTMAGGGCHFEGGIVALVDSHDHWSSCLFVVDGCSMFIMMVGHHRGESLWSLWQMRRKKKKKITTENKQVCTVKHLKFKR